VPKTEKQLQREKEKFAQKSMLQKAGTYGGYLASWLQRKVQSYRDSGKSGTTAKLSRAHDIEMSDSGLVSLLGGKWTSFRTMGEETVDEILHAQKEEYRKKGVDPCTCDSALHPKSETSRTLEFSYIGSYTRLEAINGMILTPDILYGQYKDHLIFQKDVPADVAKNLISHYGTACLRVIEEGESNKKKGLKVGLNERLHPKYPYLKSQVSYAVNSEVAVKPLDVLCRRVPLAVVDLEAAKEVLPEVTETMA